MLEWRDLTRVRHWTGISTTGKNLRYPGRPVAGRPPFSEDGTMTSFGDALRAARVGRKLSQQHLAGEVGKSQSAVSQWEDNLATPEPETVFGIERCLGMAPGALSRTLGYLPLDAVELDTETAKPGR